MTRGDEGDDYEREGFATVDKRNLKTAGMSESLNSTLTTDYRLWHISTHRSFIKGVLKAVGCRDVVQINAA